jgi:hypothetical protein
LRKNVIEIKSSATLCAVVPLLARFRRYYINARGTGTEVSMKNFVSALAAAALIAMPMAAVAQGHGGGHGGGGGGFHGASAGRGGGFHGGYGGYRGGYGYGYRGGFYPFYGAAFGLGFFAADPWFYGFPGDYWYWDGPYSCEWSCGDYYDAPPPPAPGATAPPAACGDWVWRTNPGHYEWVPQACAAPGAPPPPGS